MFHNSEHGKFVNLEVDNTSIDDLYKKFRIQKGQSTNDAIQKIDMNLFKAMNEEVKQSEIKFYAFLNKEFNILNRKYIKCSYDCYDSPAVIN